MGVLAVRQEREKRRQMDEEWTAKINILIDAQMRAEARQAKADERQAQANAEAEERQAQADERQAQANTETAVLKQALAEMARAITATNQRVDALAKGKN